MAAPRGNQDRISVARAAAVNYYGLSQTGDAFPKGTTIDFILRQETAPPKPFIPLEGDSLREYVARAVEVLWRDSVGSLSRTARIGNFDFCFYLNEGLRKSERSPLNPGSELVTRLMEDMALSDSRLVLVKVRHLGEEKLLLVNTSITM